MNLMISMKELLLKLMDTPTQLKLKEDSWTENTPSQMIQWSKLNPWEAFKTEVLKEEWHSSTNVTTKRHPKELTLTFKINTQRLWSCNKCSHNKCSLRVQEDKRLSKIYISKWFRRETQKRPLTEKWCETSSLLSTTRMASLWSISGLTRRCERGIRGPMKAQRTG